MWRVQPKVGILVKVKRLNLKLTKAYKPVGDCDSSEELLQMIIQGLQNFWIKLCAYYGGGVGGNNIQKQVLVST